MARTINTTCKPCRRASTSLCGRKKCASIRRSFTPGVHGPSRRRRLTPYGLQLREKQMARHIYGVMEKQFRNYFEKADRKSGNTADILVQLLEMRLDNVVFRLGFATNRHQARQLVTHNHFTVNGKKVDIPSYSVRVGDVVSVRDKSKECKFFKSEETIERLKEVEPPSWLTLDAGSLTGKVVAIPENEELHQPFDTKVIVEFYSR